MPKSLQQIRQDLTVFEEKTKELALELSRLYSNYLESLSQSVQQQLILACYHICTQIYPEQFLKLSFSKREKLQNNLRQLGQEIQDQLLFYSKPPSSVLQTTVTEQIVFQLSELEEPLSKINDSEVDPEFQVLKIENPEELVNWCKMIEQRINDTLESLSKKTNNYLQQAQIIPPNLPPQLLEMAFKAEEGELSAGRTPNIINLLVETNREKKEKGEESESEITRFSAIQLQLSEIVFANATLSLKRKEIRKFLEKLKKIHQSYRQAQQEYAKVEAETAWRSSWHE
ncbi:MAG: hypothetical protein ACTMUB_04805 [cyanobacterium endosymbiont of Rhopalodia musculus]|uniref:hypothetical protein n=1 Tax=cyanobacterium endosymbiont of Epithemia clementina EcSB TaxID=3034674 RepID=UPI00248057DA|nr:hypothetical protein [cyanobacterium endosymbiont of Epithemia clementina EcSB]WGT67484.1 hypothetical protein P3F56_09905 [cyanobacterium endosymbiont of Epithemia clementina EcSB]